MPKTGLGFRMFGRSEDRISNLPDTLLIHILSFLELKDAIRSSFLSRRWSNLWTFIHNLSFDSDDFKSRKSFKKFVTQVLLRRDKSDVVKVRYDDSDYMINFLPESVVHYAVRHGVQELYLKFEDDVPFLFPQCLFGCQSLRKLEVKDCRSGQISLPENLGLNALKHLSLSGFSLYEEYLDSRALSSCPNLETLILNYYQLPNAGTFDIHAPNLRRLELEGECTEIGLSIGMKFIVSAPRLKTFKFTACTPIVCSMDCPSLEQAIIDVYPCNVMDEMEESLCAHFVRLVNECRNAKSIMISLDTLKVLSTFPALLEEHSSTFGQLECLSLQRKSKYYRPFELPPCILTYFRNGSSNVTVRVC